MKSGFLQFDQSSIHYLRWGNGEKILVCFHGYGETAAHFQFLGTRLAHEFTIISLDLPFHGETDWQSGTLDDDKLQSLVEQILLRENLPQSGIYLMGFSMGGRLALCLFEKIPNRVEKLVLLAPDGLKLNFWYWFSTQTLIGNKCFKLTMSSPGWFLGMLRFGNKIGVINRSIFKFVEYYIHDEQVRSELYNRWTRMRKCKPSLTAIKNQIRQNATTVRLLYGKHDRIILPSPALRFIDGLSTATITVLDCGHQVLHSKNVEAIAEALIN